MKRLVFVTSVLFAPALVFSQGRGLDPADILKPLTDQWTSYSGDLTGKRFSHLNLINKDTVKNLGLKWVSNGITTGCGPTGTPPVSEGAGGRGGGGRFGPAAAPAPVIVGGIGNGEDNVNAWFGGQSWHRGRACVLQQLELLAERGADARSLALIEDWPLRIVVGNDDNAIIGRRRSDAHGQDLFFAVWKL